MEFHLEVEIIKKGTGLTDPFYNFTVSEKFSNACYLL